jgi:hypothetical protein
MTKQDGTVRKCKRPSKPRVRRIDEAIDSRLATCASGHPGRWRGAREQLSEAFKVSRQARSRNEIHRSLFRVRDVGVVFPILLLHLPHILIPVGAPPIQGKMDALEIWGNHWKSSHDVDEKTPRRFKGFPLDS